MRYFASREHSAAPYRVDYFYAVAIAHGALCVQALWNDFAVYFDGYLALCVAFGIEQFADAEICRYLARRAIEKYPDHRPSLTRRRSPGLLAAAKKNSARDVPGACFQPGAVSQWPPPPFLSLSLSLSLLLSFLPCCCCCGCGGG